ncbi:serine/threonine-protein kinase PknK [Haliangium sp.]|uniref:serine/threonine-protein kinase n=1 Tax=Haliangium sp. TaxID=2663208 RepID=UPI003D131B4D
MQSGDTIADRFEIERAVAAGGMGRIYRARDRHSGEHVAIKLLTKESERALDRFLQESRVLAEIQHPGVVRYISHGRMPGGAAYLAMEWLEGEDLARYLKRHGSAITTGAIGTGVPMEEGQPPIAAGTDSASSPSGTFSEAAPGRRRPSRLSIAQTLILGRRLASAVAELHRRGIVHRDIKPSNVFLPGSVIEHLKVVDLGAVWRDTPAARARCQEGILGTPHYMAPEQARADGVITSATDVWAIGCVLYLCLTGIKPFTGDDPMTILARIIVDDPMPVEALRADIPQPLADLIGKTMCKEPTGRPSDAAALAAMLEHVGAAGDRDPAGSALRTSRQPRTPPLGLLTSSERRVTCVVLAAFAAPSPDREQDRPDDDPGADLRVLRRAVQAVGAQLSRLADGSLLITVPEADLPTDQAARAARAALAVRDACPSLRLVLAAGRSEGIKLVGQALSAAARTLRALAPGRIHLDQLSASLIEARFHIAHGPEGASLGRERIRDERRVLLGRPTPWVGRDRELERLAGAFERCVGERRAQAVLVTAPAGLGKSRLRAEFEASLQSRGDLEIIRGHGDMASAGSPFLLIAPALRRLAGILDGEPVEVARDKLRARVGESVAVRERERVTLFLGELAGIPFDAGTSEALTAARGDPMLMGQLMQAAWEDWLRAECARHPVVLMLEDLHWGDLPSVLYVGAALRGLREQPLFVVALARPEVEAVFPRLWEDCELDTLHLGPLPRDAGGRLVRAVLGEDVDAALADFLVRRADGNAFFLEELIRSAAEADAGGLPETVLGMIEARLDNLGPEAKRLLRAASVFGETFWQGGVAALSGGGGAFHLHEWLDDLVAREIIVRQPESRIPGEVEYRFRHALVRDAAYAMLTAEDRRLGHALAGTWLVRAGERDGRILAEHFLRGERPSQAVPHLVRAAEQALEGNDLQAVIDLGERGAGAQADGVALGRLRGLQSVASYWRGDHAGGRRFGVAAAKLLEAGTGIWFVAVGTAMASCARLGDWRAIDELATAALTVRCEPGAESQQLICLCRLSFQLLFNGHYERGDRALDRIIVLAAEAGTLDALTQAHVHHLQSLRSALAGDIERTLRRLTLSVDAFERAGDIRNVALERTSLAWWWGELGYAVHAAKLCEENLRFCIEQRAQQATTFAQINLGFLLAKVGRLERAKEVLEEAAAVCRAVGNARMEGWSCTNMAEVAHAGGDHGRAEEEAGRAVELLEVSPSLRAWALAVHARALLALGQVERAQAQARASVTIAGQVRLIHGASLPHLVLAQALHAGGDHDDARAALRTAVATLAARAGKLERSGWRERFLAKPEHRTIQRLAEAWLD